MTFDPEEGAYVTEFDRGDVSPSVTTISVIAEITGQSATDFRPLYHVVDSDALDQIVRNRPSDLHRNRLFVEFTYQNYTIQILNSGVLKVYP